MKVVHWKNSPEVWSAMTIKSGVELETGSKEEMVLMLAAEGWELDYLDLSCMTDDFEVWTVRKFPGNSLEKDRRQC